MRGPGVPCDADSCDGMHGVVLQALAGGLTRTGLVRFAPLLKGRGAYCDPSRSIPFLCLRCMQFQCRDALEDVDVDLKELKPTTYL